LGLVVELFEQLAQFPNLTKYQQGIEDIMDFSGKAKNFN
jgi:hypothetical protein